VPTIKPGREWGLGTDLPEEIEWVGDPPEQFVHKAFKVVRAPVKPPTYSTVVPVFRNLISPRPVIDAARCNQCGTCVRACPVSPKAVDWHDGDALRTRPPSYKYERCIRCFCCQELCPERAISVTTPRLGRLLQPRQSQAS
jgi:formate hydrogenlyase subunit 6/NADH:ubiquinone oxidoreductase subunit I